MSGILQIVEPRIGNNDEFLNSSSIIGSSNLACYNHELCVGGIYCNTGLVYSSFSSDSVTPEL